MIRFEDLQGVGKALMTPVAILPVAALLLRFGSPDLLDIPLLAKAGGVAFDNLPTIFAIGIAFGLTKDTHNNGVAGLAGFIACTILNESLKVIDPELDMGFLAGIVSGLTAGFLYNRFYKIRLPEFLAFFGGRRFVPIVTSFAAIGLAIVFGFIWPPIQHAINSFGELLISLGGFGTFVYGVCNRALIPLGLHHILNDLIWFVFGSYTVPETGVVVTGDLNRFFAGDPKAGIFMSGGFPIMMFGLPAVALAMYRTAKPENRKKVAGALMSMALTSFLTGITEPIEFSFLFLAPVLYVFHAFLFGVSMWFCCESGILIGFGFSPSFIDMILSWGISTRPALIIPMGLVFGTFYYLVFSWVIETFDLPTLGRYDEGVSGFDNLDTEEFAAQIVKGLGGKENLSAVDNCATRLRVTVKDSAKVDEKILQASGVKGIFRSGNAIQVVIGTQVEFVADEINSFRRS